MEATKELSPLHRHLSLFATHFNGHLPFIHMPTIFELFEDTFGHHATARSCSHTQQKNKNDDSLKQHAGDLLRAMAMVGALYDQKVEGSSPFPPAEFSPDPDDGQNGDRHNAPVKEEESNQEDARDANDSENTSKS